MDFLREIPAGDEEKFNVVVENVKGTSNKIEFDEELKAFTLDRVLYSPVFWPFDYGFIPQTWSEDEDPIDVVLLTTYPTFPGCVVKARTIGLIVMEDEKGEDDKIIAVPVKDPRFEGIKSIDDLPEHQKKEIQDFFESYKKLEPGKFVKFKRFESVEKAKQKIREAVKRYKKKFGE